MRNVVFPYNIIFSLLDFLSCEDNPEEHGQREKTTPLRMVKINLKIYSVLFIPMFIANVNTLYHSAMLAPHSRKWGLPHSSFLSLRLRYGSSYRRFRDNKYRLKWTYKQKAILWYKN